MNRLLIILFSASFCFGQFFYHILDEVEFYAGTSSSPDAWVEVLNDKQIIVSYAEVGQILASYSYSSSYVLTKQDTLIHVNAARECPISRISDTHLWVLQGNISTSAAKIYSINGAGAFTKLDSLDNLGTIGSNNSAVAMSSTVFAAVTGRANTDEVLTTFMHDGSYNISEEDQITFDAGGKGDRNDIWKLDVDHFLIFWLDDQSDLGFQTGSYDGAWAATMIGSEVEVNVNASGFGAVLMNETTAVCLSNYGTNKTYAEYYVVEWDVDFTNIAVVDNINGGTLIMHDGYPALHRYNDTTVIALTGAPANVSQIRSFTLDGENQLTSNEDQVEWLPSGNVSPDDMRLAAFDDSTIVVVTKDLDNDLWLVTIRISETEEAPIFPTGWAHSVLGVETPTAVNSASEFTKVSGVE